MKLLMFGWEFPPHISGGLGTACLGLTQGLSNHKVEILFVLPKIKDAASPTHLRLIGASGVKPASVEEHQEFHKENLNTIHINSPLTPYQSAEEYATQVSRLQSESKVTSKDEYFFSDLDGNYGANIMSEIFRYSAIARIIARRESFDLIHVHDWMTYPAGIEAKRISGKPLIVHVHSLEYDRSGDNVNREIYELERQGLEAADRIIAVSYYTKDLIMRHYRIPDSKIRVVHNAVSQEKQIERMNIRKPLQEKIVLFLGRITFQKGPDYFVEAAKIVIDRIKNVRFVMAGTGDMFTRMVERMAQLRIGQHFHFTGFLRGADVEKMYAMSDLYVMPSVSEPFGIAPLEAMNYNVPVIVSKQSGVAEILPHAIKVDFWDIHQLAEKIIHVLTNPNLSKAMVDANTRQIQEIKWEKAAARVLDVYRELV